MGTTAVDPVFVDTNILIYAQQALSPFHAPATSKMRDLAALGHVLCVSRQVFREYLAVMSQPAMLTASVPMASLLADIQMFEKQFFIAEDGPAVTAHLLNVLASIPCMGKLVHDANIVATMLAHGIPQILTHNVADFGKFHTFVKVISLVP